MSAPTPRRSALLAGGIALFMVGGGAYVRHVRSARVATARAAAAVSASVAHGDPVLRIPHAPGAIVLDGDTDDPGWVRPPGPARTGGFALANGEEARPYSNARLVWGDGYLYLSLYAADEDIETRPDGPGGPAGVDAFRIVFARHGVEYALEVSPDALITDSIRKGPGEWESSWRSGAHASREIDGTPDSPGNTDEEWAIELAVPFESIGMTGERGETIGLSLSRCDTPKGVPRVCAGWGEGADGHPRGRLVLE